MKLTEKDLRTLQNFFESHPKVISVYLFGSQVKGETHFASDFDIALSTTGILTLDEKASLIADLTSALETDSIDVVFLNDVSSVRLKFNIISKGRVVVSKNERKRTKFEEEVISEFLLLKPALDEYDEHFLKEVDKSSQR